MNGSTKISHLTITVNGTTAIQFDIITGKEPKR